MPKHHSKPDSKGEGVKLVGSPNDLINLLVADEHEKKRAIDQLINEGPKHKQVLSALLMKRLYKLVRAIEKNSGMPFALQKGVALIDAKEKDAIPLPIPFPLNLGASQDKKKVTEAISHAPEHEALAYAACLQVVEWAIKATAKKA